MNQKQATCSALLTVLKDRGINYELNGDQSISQFLTKADRDKVVTQLMSGFRSGSIDMTEEARAKYKDDKALKVYVVGLVNNWIRKEPTFNGGSKYQAKNPGSRSGSQDAVIKNLKLLKSTLNDAKKIAEVDKAIQERLAAIKPAQTVEIDMSAIPEHLRHLVTEETEEVEA